MMSRTSSPTTMSPDQSHHQLTTAAATASSCSPHRAGSGNGNGNGSSGPDNTIGSSEVSPMNADAADGRDNSQEERCRSPDYVNDGRKCSDYFRPLKRLRMVEREQQEAAAAAVAALNVMRVNGPTSLGSRNDDGCGAVAPKCLNAVPSGGSKPPTSFSIRDILSPRAPIVVVTTKPQLPPLPAATPLHPPPLPPPPPPPPLPPPPTTSNELHVRIVRPWDLRDEDRSQRSTNNATANFRFRNSSTGDVQMDDVDGDEDEDVEVDGDDYELDNDSRASLESPDERKGVGGTTRRCGGGGATHSSATSAASANKNNDSPLDALFQMTSKAFEGLNNGHNSSADPSRDHLHIFSSRPTAKKKRKSRTAFSNHQIFELEKRFLYQKYLSPADRDEIAQSLVLTNAQVITWFQNRRAKLKRDMEELKKDVDSSKTMHVHSSSSNNNQNNNNNNNNSSGVVHLHHPRPAHPHPHTHPHPHPHALALRDGGVQDLSLMKPEMESSPPPPPQPMTTQLQTKGLMNCINE